LAARYGPRRSFRLQLSLRRALRRNRACGVARRERRRRRTGALSSSTVSLRGAAARSATGPTTWWLPSPRAPPGPPRDAGGRGATTVRHLGHPVELPRLA
jgi:hypothetical protein